MKRGRLLGAACLLVVALASPLARADAASQTGALSAPIVGQPDSKALFSTTFRGLDNRPVPFANYSGRPLVVNFWARWCPPCRVEIPELVALQSRQTGVEVVGINIEADPVPVGDFAHAYDVNYPVLLMGSGVLDLMRSLGNRVGGVPYTVILNQHGVIVAQHAGAMSRPQLDAAVALALH